MRGGLDDALEKLARRDELRRRAAGEAAGTPPAVTDLVEAVAAVVARYPELGITMGVEGAGDPVLLRFAVDDGIVQVSADSPLTARTADAGPASHRHADFDLDLDPLDVSSPAAPPGQVRHRTDPGADATTRHTHDHGSDRDGVYGRAADFDAPHPYSARATFEPLADGDPSAAFQSTAFDSTGFDSTGYDSTGLDSTGLDSAGFEPSGFEPTGGGSPTEHGARRDRAAHAYEPRTYEPHPYAATPPPAVPPQTRSASSIGDRRPTRQIPEPLPTPVPLREEPEATELAAKRLSALLREDPSLLRVNPQD